MIFTILLDTALIPKMCRHLLILTLLLPTRLLPTNVQTLYASNNACPLVRFQHTCRHVCASSNAFGHLSHPSKCLHAVSFTKSLHTHLKHLQQLLTQPDALHLKTAEEALAPAAAAAVGVGVGALSAAAAAAELTVDVSAPFAVADA